MDFPYKKILEQAYTITRQHKFLWVFGLFLVLVVALQSIPIEINNNWISFLAWVVFLLIIFRIKTGLIVAIKALFEKQETDLKKSFRAAKFFYKRVVGQTVVASLIFLMIFFTIAFLLYPFIAGFTGVEKQSLIYYLAIILTPVFLTFQAIIEFGSLFVVFHDLMVGESITSSFNLVGKRLGTAVVLSFILTILPLLPIIFLVLVKFLTFDRIILAAVSLFFLPLLSIIMVFVQAAWLLAFKELVRPAKLEEDRSFMPLPEIVS